MSPNIANYRFMIEQDESTLEAVTSLKPHVASVVQAVRSIAEIRAEFLQAALVFKHQEDALEAKYLKLETLCTTKYVL